MMVSGPCRKHFVEVQGSAVQVNTEQLIAQRAPMLAPPKSTRAQEADIVMGSFQSLAPKKANKRRTLV